MQTTQELSSYESFRDFLKDFLECEKSLRGLGLSHFAACLGVSPALMSLVLKGKRELSLPLLHRIASYLQMDVGERTLFETMVLLEQSTTADERHHYSQRLAGLRAQRHVTTVRKPTSVLIERPEIPSLLVYLLDVVSASERAAWLSSQGELDARHVAALAQATGRAEADIRRLLDEIRSAGFLSVDDQGATHFRFDGLSSRRHQVRHLSAILTQLAQRMDGILAQPDSLARSFAFSTTEDGLKALRDDLRSLFHRAMEEGVAALEEGRKVCLVEAAVVVTPLLRAAEVDLLRE